MRVRVEDACIDALTNRRCRDHFTGVGIHDHHHHVLADGKKTPVLPVHRESAWRIAGAERPAMERRQLFRVELQDLVLVREVYEHAPLTIGHSEFGPAAEGHGARNHSVHGVDGGGVWTIDVHREDALCDLIIYKRVGVLTGLYGADFSQRFQIDDCGSIRAGVGRKATADVGCGDQAVGLLQTGYLAHDGAGVDVHHVYMISPADVETPGRAIHGQVVPALRPADGDGFQ